MRMQAAAQTNLIKTIKMNVSAIILAGGIDHINGKGTEHRKKIGFNIYPWLVKNNFPEGFQTLCCNCSKGHLGYCPHEKSSHK